MYLKRLDYSRTYDKFYTIAETDEEIGLRNFRGFGEANIAVSHMKGQTESGYIYCDGLLFSENEGGFTVVEQLELQDVTGWQYGEYFATSVDMSGSGRESIVLSQFLHLQGDGNDNCAKTTIIQKDYESDDDKFIVSDVRRVGYKDHVQTVTALNTDEDSVSYAYTGEHYYYYNDPQIVSVILSPPYFGDLEHLDGGDSYVGNSETSYGEISGSGSSFLASAAVSIGPYIEGGIGAGFMGNGGSVTYDYANTFDFTYDMELAAFKEYSITYGTLGGQDTVALISAVEERFVYDYTYMNPDTGLVETEEIIQCLPYSASVKTFSSDEYDKIINKASITLPKMEGNVLKHTLGDPGSYSGLSDYYDDVGVLEFSPQGPINIGLGASAYTSLEGTDTQENSYQWQFGGTVSGKIGAKAEWDTGVKGETEIGISVDVSASAGFGKYSTYGNTYAGTLMGLPSDASGYGYNYDWNIFKGAFDASMDPDSEYSGTFPVIGYEIYNLTSPPSLPDDFAQNYEASTAHEIVMEWTSDDSTVYGFQVYRMETFSNGEEAIPVGDMVSASDTAFWDEDLGDYVYQVVDENLMASCNFIYKIQSIGYGAENKSVLSDDTSAMTKLEKNHPVAELEDNFLQLYPDRVGTMNVSVLTDGYVTQTMYQWQVYENGSWVDVPFQTESQLIFSTPEIEDEGTYRCKVSQTVDGVNATAYSDLLTVAYSKHVTDLEVTADGSNLLINVSNPTDTTASKITGYIDLVVYEGGMIVDGGDDLAVEDGLAVWAGLSGLESTYGDGVYEVKVTYSGDGNFKGLQTMKLFMIGDQAGYIALMDSEIAYGDTIVPKVYRVTRSGDDLLTEEVEDGADGMTIDCLWIEGMHQTDDITYTTRQIGQGLKEEAATSGMSLLEAVEYYYGYWLFEYLSEDRVSQTGKHIAVIEVRQDGLIVDEIMMDFTVVTREVSLQCPSMTTNYKNAKLIYDEPIVVVDSQLAYDDSVSSLGLTLDVKTASGSKVDTDYLTYGYLSPGSYTTHLEESLHSTYGQYDFNELAGDLILTAAYYTVTTTAHDYLGEKVGDMGVSSPVGYDGEYPYNSDMVFLAVPYGGYTVDYWVVKSASALETDVGTVIPADDDSPNVLTQTLLADGLDVHVYFELKENTLSFGGENGSVNCVSSDLLTSGDKIMPNASFTFEAVPDEGYHFVEWQLTESETTYPTGTVTDEGIHQLEHTCQDLSTVIAAVFERDSYEIILGDYLILKYMGDHDDNLLTADEEITVMERVLVPGGTDITVEALPGYYVDTAQEWLVDGIGTGILADTYQMTVTKDVTIEASTVQMKFDVTVSEEWIGTTEELSGNEVYLYVDGVLQDETSLTDLPGGVKITAVADAGYGMVFDYWLVNGLAVNGEQLEDVITYVCENLGEDLDISAVFNENEVCPVTVVVDQHGSLEAQVNDGNWIFVNDGTIIKVYKGDEVNFRATPDREFMVGQWVVTRTDAAGDEVQTFNTAVKTLTVEDIASPHTVEVVFQSMIYYELSTKDCDVFVDGEPAQMDSGTSKYIIGGGKKIELTARQSMVESWYKAAYFSDGSKEEGTVLNDFGVPYVGATLVIEAMSSTLEVFPSFTGEKGFGITADTVENIDISWTVDPDYYGDMNKVRANGSVTIMTEGDNGVLPSSVRINCIDGQMAADEVNRLSDGSLETVIYQATEDVHISVTTAAGIFIEVLDSTGGKAEVDTTAGLPGTLVTATATTDKGYIHDGWEVLTFDGSDVSDMESSLNSSSTFIMTTSAALKAVFDAVEYPVTVNNINGGVVTVDHVKAGAGEEVSVSIMTDAGYTVSGWVVNLENGSNPLDIMASLNATGKFHMPYEGVTIEPVYTYSEPIPMEHPVTVVNIEGGTVSADFAACIADTLVTVTTSTDTGCSLNGWTVVLQDSSDETTLKNTLMTTGSFLMPDTGVTLTPIYKKDDISQVEKYTVGVHNSIGGIGSVNISEAEAGTLITATAVPAEGYILEGWGALLIGGGDNTAIVNTLNTAGNFLMPESDVAIVPIFAKETVAETYSITVNNVTGGSVSANVSEAEAGTVISVSLTTDYKYSHDGWKVTLANGDSTTLIASMLTNFKEFVMPSTDVTIEPIFSYVTSNNGNGNGSGSSSNGGSSSKTEVVTIAEEAIAQAGIFDTGIIWMDVPQDHWAYDDIMALTDLGYLDGIAPSMFGPDDAISREAFTAYMVNVLDKFDETALEGFDDVVDGDKYQQHIASAAIAELIKGYSDQEFGAGDQIKRQDIVVILMRALGDMIDVESSSFEDCGFVDKMTISNYAQSAVADSVNYSLITGYQVEDGRMEFRPANNMTRAEAAVVLHRFFTKYMETVEE